MSGRGTAKPVAREKPRNTARILAIPGWAQTTLLHNSRVTRPVGGRATRLNPQALISALISLTQKIQSGKKHNRSLTRSKGFFRLVQRPGLKRSHSDNRKVSLERGKARVYKLSAGRGRTGNPCRRARIESRGRLGLILFRLAGEPGARALDRRKSKPCKGNFSARVSKGLNASLLAETNESNITSGTLSIFFWGLPHNLPAPTSAKPRLKVPRLTRCARFSGSLRED